MLLICTRFKINFLLVFLELSKLQVHYNINVLELTKVERRASSSKSLWSGCLFVCFLGIPVHFVIFRVAGRKHWI